MAAASSAQQTPQALVGLNHPTVHEACERVPASLHTACPSRPASAPWGLHDWPCAGDIIATCSAIEGPEAAVPNVQYFWEAFPAGSGPTDRTTYMFAYMDAEPHRQASTLNAEVSSRALSTPHLSAASPGSAHRNDVVGTMPHLSGNAPPSVPAHEPCEKGCSGLSHACGSSGSQGQVQAGSHNPETRTEAQHCNAL